MGLNRLMLFTADNKERAELLKWLVPKFIENQARLPRRDLTLYVRWLLQGDLDELAQDFISNARNLHEYSRSLKLAENLLEHSKKKIR